MYFYEVIVADSSYKSDKALTYQSEEKLPLYSIVIVSVKRKNVPGIIINEVPKPSFATKPIDSPAPLLPIPEELVALGNWLRSFYAVNVGITTQQFLPRNIVGRKQFEYTENTTDMPITHLPALTVEQQNILQQFNSPDTYILHGETGTGKTRIYIELALQEFKRGKSSIILTPEIGLTPQLARAFEEVFGTNNVVITHSQLTEKERAQSWLHVLLSEHPVVVLGPRSALFMPLRNIGLIVLDESHETSYKQEQSPHYHASKVAAKLASLHAATLVLGSATPSITDYFLADTKQKHILRMHKPARKDVYPATTHIVDLKDRTEFTKQPHLSNTLLAAIHQSMDKGEQSLVFLNRRGTARTVLCQHCGWQAMCEHCNLPLTYHGDAHNMRCHTCGFVIPAPTSCPICRGTNILLKNVGTKAIVDELVATFPHARIQRFDTDNTKHERLEAHYHAVQSGDIDIVVGTQIIAKGLDLPKLSTVGVVSADTSLYLPDYTAEERSYQLLRQVIGRVGRGHRSSTVVIQTYDPQSPLIRAAVAGSWSDFYKQQLQERKKFVFPPFCHTLKISCRRASSKSAQQAGLKVVADLRANKLRVSIDGPMPSFHEKMGDKHQWQIILKAKDRAELLKAIRLLPANWSYDIDPSNLL